MPESDWVASKLAARDRGVAHPASRLQDADVNRYTIITTPHLRRGNADGFEDGNHPSAPSVDG